MKVFTVRSTDAFLEEVERVSFSVRKPSSRKAKKIAAMDTALCGMDALVSNQLRMQQASKAARKPPTGKTWLKQVFAGQMGLTILAVFHGMVLVSLATSPWTAGMLDSCWKASASPRLPTGRSFCTVLTQPCGPWGKLVEVQHLQGWQRFCHRPSTARRWSSLAESCQQDHQG